MRIPKTFKCMNRRWHVRYVKLENNYGLTNFGKAEVLLDRKLLAKRHDDLRMHTFMHELLHVCAGSMGWKRVNKDEKNIDVLAALLVQAMGSSCS